MSAAYRCVAESLAGFVQQVAVSYVKNGYWFYVAGAVPDGKSLQKVDDKFVRLYGLSISKYVRVGGYSIAYRNGRVSVRIEKAEYRLLKDAFLRRSLNAKNRLEAAFSALPYEPYGPVRSQLVGLLRAVNRRRAVAGLPLVERGCVRLSRRIVRPFGDG